MSIYQENGITEKALFAIAQNMVIAARTAPKGKGTNNLVVALIDGDDIKRVAKELECMGRELEIGAFIRDAENIRSSSVMVALGTKIAPLGLKKCGMCGYADCKEKAKHPNVPCVFNTGDLGIAIGSAVSIATDNRVDNRIMYTVGQALIKMKLLGNDVRIAYAIPLSATSKNPFFDRS